MTRRSLLALSALVLSAVAQPAAAQIGTQLVTFEVTTINELAFSGSPSLVISSAIAGNAPTSASASGSYAITTNETDRTITAELDVDMPAGLALFTTLAAPGAGTSAGPVALSTMAQVVVTGIEPVEASGLAVNYGLTATTSAGVVPSTSRTVTYTIISGA